MALARLRGVRLGRPLLVAALGALLFGVATWNFDRELESMNVLTGPVAAYVVDGIPVLLVLFLGYWLYRSEFDAEKRWQVAIASWIGAVVVCGVFARTILIGVAEGRTVGEPVFTLSVGGDAGAIVGWLVGLFYVRARRDAAEAKRARDLDGVLTHRTSTRRAGRPARSRSRSIRFSMSGWVESNRVRSPVSWPRTESIPDPAARPARCAAGRRRARGRSSPPSRPPACRGRSRRTPARGRPRAGHPDDDHQ